MREWRRVPFEQKCGLCGLRFQRGTVMLLLGRENWRKWRCQSCAGSPAPADETVPKIAEPITEHAMTRISALRNKLPFDVKAAQTKESA